MVSKSLVYAEDITDLEKMKSGTKGRGQGGVTLHSCGEVDYDRKVRGGNKHFQFGAPITAGGKSCRPIKAKEKTAKASREVKVAVQREARAA